MSTTAKAHGLDGAWVAPDWPPLTLAEVRSVLASYPQLGRAAKLLTVSPRPFSAASVVATETGCVFVKRHAYMVRNAQALCEEHRFMQYLRAHGASVPEVVPSLSGDTALEREEGTYEVHTLPEGIDLYGEAISWTPFFSAGHARSAGEALARLHLAAEGYEAPTRILRPLVAGFTIFAAGDPYAGWDSYVESRPSLHDYLKSHDRRNEALELLRPFHQELAPLLPSLQPLWTHNDLHPSNMFWSNATDSALATAVIDFGLCDRSNAVHDIAQAIERSIPEWLVLMDNPASPERVPIHFDHLFAFLDGYDAARPLAVEEAAALAPMAAVCHAEFALSEADYFLTALNSEEKARVACEDYLIGHARWFRGAGARMLDAIHDWANHRNTRKGEPTS